MTDALLKVSDLKVHYPVRGGFLGLSTPSFVRAVDGVNLELKTGEILGLVGESGCGKSSLGRAIMRLIPASAGRVELLGLDFLSLGSKALKSHRPNMQMVFQDPYASLNPRMTVFDTLAEPLRVHARLGGTTLSEREIEQRIHEILDVVRLSAKSARKYPHEFSGGQRQRIAIARALILKPKVIIADEPVSSLDVSVQAQILNLLKDIQKEFGLSMIFISHNLAVVKYISDRIAVMYLGKVVETATREALYQSPKHPYTQALVSAVPIPDPIQERKRVRIQVRGELPSPLNPPKGCAFNSRCAIAVDQCRTDAPALLSLKADPSRKVACYKAE